jgi:hypothetical protein
VIIPSWIVGVRVPPCLQWPLRKYPDPGATAGATDLFQAHDQSGQKDRIDSKSGSSPLSARRTGSPGASRPLFAIRSDGEGRQRTTHEHLPADGRPRYAAAHLDQRPGTGIRPRSNCRFGRNPNRIAIHSACLLGHRRLYSPAGTGDVIRWCAQSCVETWQMLGRGWQMLGRGKSPHWTRVHACINRQAYNLKPCDNGNSAGLPP